VGGPGSGSLGPPKSHRETTTPRTAELVALLYTGAISMGAICSCGSSSVVIATVAMVTIDYWVHNSAQR